MPQLKILLVHNRYLQSGGEDHVFAAELALLRAHGHQVETLVEDNRRIAALGGARTAVRTLWSQETVRTVKAKAEAHAYDVVHVHNFFPLVSPAVYYAARAANAAVVQTLHNYRLLCPNALFFRDGRTCQDCLGKAVAWPGVAHACYRDSRPQTAVVAGLLTTHRLLRTWQRRVDRYIALSSFAREQFITGGLPAEKVVTKPNFLAADPGVGPATREPFALFVGRLSAEKGIHTLLEAWQTISAPQLKIVGDGPLAPAVEQAARVNPALEWLGSQGHAAVMTLMQRARFVVLPSTCFENFPLVLLEAFACGTPALVSRLGSMREIVTEGQTGLHFTVGNAAELAARASWLESNPLAATRMGRTARTQFEATYTAEDNYQRLINIYDAARAS